MRRRWLILTLGLWLGAALLAAPPALARGGSVEGACLEAVAEMQALTADLEFPEHLQDENEARQEGDFNVMDYFTVLDHLKMDEGYVLDYVYQFDGMGGYPVLYARPEDEEPYTTYDELVKAYPDGLPDYLEFIRVDDEASGYLQLVVLSVMADQFYLFWHANYNDHVIVCDEEALEAILTEYEPGTPLAMPEDVVAQAREINVLPWVSFQEDYVEVSVVRYTGWGGFTRWTYHIESTFPHALTYKDPVVLVEYVIPLMF